MRHAQTSLPFVNPCIVTYPYRATVRFISIVPLPWAMQTGTTTLFVNVALTSLISWSSHCSHFCQFTDRNTWTNTLTPWADQIHNMIYTQRFSLDFTSLLRSDTHIHTNLSIPICVPRLSTLSGFAHRSFPVLFTRRNSDTFRLLCLLKPLVKQLDVLLEPLRFEGVFWYGQALFCCLHSYLNTLLFKRYTHFWKCTDDCPDPETIWS